VNTIYMVCGRVKCQNNAPSSRVKR